MPERVVEQIPIHEDCMDTNTRLLEQAACVIDLRPEATSSAQQNTDDADNRTQSDGSYQHFSSTFFASQQQKPQTKAETSHASANDEKFTPM